jgi:hypothetical protein
MEQRMLLLEAKFLKQEKELAVEREKNLLLEKKLLGERPTSPDSKGSRRRRRSRKRPRTDDEPLEAIDRDAVSVQPDWETLSAVISQYAEATKGTKPGVDSALLAESPAIDR